MRELEHLKEYDLTLTTRAPLFIGSGEKYGKKEYLYDPGSRKVTFLDRDRFFDLLIRKDLADEYEAFMLSGEASLSRFLRRDCRLTEEELASVSSYSVNVGEALDENHSLKEIHRFIRNAEGEAYVPGSSVKGALRTAMLVDMILGKDPKPLGTRLYEDDYFNTLALAKRKGQPDSRNAANSIMQGIRVSDSQPIPGGRMILGGKYDADRNGEYHQINLCRECVAPGTEIHMKLVLDNSILKGKWDAEKILSAVSEFMELQKQNWLYGFRKPEGAGDVPEKCCLFLGGGAGFVSKTANYAFYDLDDAVKDVSEKLGRAFRKHHHDRDVELGVSPRMVKYTKYSGVLYPVGLCEVSLT